MEEWKIYKLGDICTKIGSGATPSGGKEAYKGGDFNLVRSQNVLDFSFSWDGLAQINDEQAEKLKNVELRENDVLLNITGDSVARACIVPSSVLPARVNQHVAIVRPNEKLIYSYYLLCFLQFQKTNFLSLASGGATRNALTKSMIENFEITLPPLSTQYRITSILKSLDDKIEVNRQINDNLPTKAFIEVLLIWILTSLKNDNLEQQGQALFEEYIMNPDMPRTRLLSDYAHINPTRTIGKGKVARCIDMSSLPTKGTFPNDWVFKEYNGGMKFQNGDTIMARITPCLENGKTAYINFLEDNEVAYGSTEYIVLSPQDGFCAEMLYFLARHDDFVSYAVAHMNGSSGRQRVSGNDIANYVMPEIKTDALRIIGVRLHGIMEVIKNNSLESRHLAEIRDTLLPKLMSGELKPEQLNK